MDREIDDQKVKLGDFIIIIVLIAVLYKMYVLWSGVEECSWLGKKKMDGWDV